MHPHLRIITIVFIACVLLGPTAGSCATLSYEYDRLNRLTSVTYGDGTRIAYAYDAAGNRLSRTVSKVVITFRGDINGDDLVNLEDAILVLQVVSNLNPDGIRSNYADSGADANNNQRIGTEDAIYILQKAAGMR